MTFEANNWNWKKFYAILLERAYGMGREITNTQLCSIDKKRSVL